MKKKKKNHERNQRTISIPILLVAKMAEEVCGNRRFYNSILTLVPYPKPKIL